MLELTVWKNQQLGDLRRDIDRLFDRVWSDFGVSLIPGEFMRGPAVKVFEDEDALRIKVEIPGVDAESLRLSVFRNILTIQGEICDRVMQENEAYRKTRRRFGSFSRRITLPCRVREDAIEAVLKDGTLLIVMPKLEPEQRPGIRIKIV